MDLGEAVIAGAVAGVVCGLVPFVVGLVRGDTPLAVGGLAACILGGVVLGLILGIPLAILFTVLIVRRTKRRDAAGGAQEPGVGAAPR